MNGFKRWCNRMGSRFEYYWMCINEFFSKDFFYNIIKNKYKKIAMMMVNKFGITVMEQFLESKAGCPCYVAKWHCNYCIHKTYPWSTCLGCEGSVTWAKLTMKEKKRIKKQIKRYIK